MFAQRLAGTESKVGTWTKIGHLFLLVVELEEHPPTTCVPKMEGNGVQTQNYIHFKQMLTFSFTPRSRSEPAAQVPETAFFDYRISTNLVLDSTN